MNKKILIAVIVIAAISVGILFLNPGLTGAATSRSTYLDEVTAALTAERVKVGTIAPDFELADINEKSFKLSDFKGNPAILYFFSTTCTICMKKSRELKELYAKHGPAGMDILNIVSVSVDGESNEEIRLFKEEFGGEWTWASDRKKLAFRYDVLSTSQAFLLDENQKVLAIEYSPSNEYIENILEL